MPYIPNDDRKYLLNGSYVAKTAGELNYMISKLFIDIANEAVIAERVDINEMSSKIIDVINDYIENKYKLENSKLSYQLLNDVMGALAGAIFEFSRRTNGTDSMAEMFNVFSDATSLSMCLFYNTIVAPYEEIKIVENGDIYNELKTDGKTIKNKDQEKPKLENENEKIVDLEDFDFNDIL